MGSPWQRCQCSQKPWPTRSRNMVRLLNPLAHVIDHGSYGSCGGLVLLEQSVLLRMLPSGSSVCIQKHSRALSSRSDETSSFAESGSKKPRFLTQMTAERRSTACSSQGCLTLPLVFVVHTSAASTARMSGKDSHALLVPSTNVFQSCV